jgi:hypothetical protein
MFIIVEGERVVLGPMDWKPNYFSTFIKDEYNIVLNLPLTNTTNNSFSVSNTVKILPVRADPDPAHNTKTQYLSASQFRVYNDSADSYRSVVDKTIDQIKNEMIALVPAARWTKENKGVTVTINNKKILADTSREKRNTYINGVAGSWKVTIVDEDVVHPMEVSVNSLSVEWVNLTQYNLSTIDTAIKNYIQSLYDWEKTTIEEISSKQTIAELNAYNF